RSMNTWNIWISGSAILIRTVSGWGADWSISWATAGPSRAANRPAATVRRVLVSHIRACLAGSRGSQTQADTVNRLRRRTQACDGLMPVVQPALLGSSPRRARLSINAVVPIVHGRAWSLVVTVLTRVPRRGAE